MGNHSCACSWSMVPKAPCGSAAVCTITNIGYSIPPTGPATLVACGYGYGKKSDEYVRMLQQVCSFDLPGAAGTRHLVVGLAEDAVPARRVPAEVGRAGPRDVAHALGPEAPRPRAGDGARARRLRLVAGDDRDDAGVAARRGGARAGAREARTLRAREHLVGVLQHAA